MRPERLMTGAERAAADPRLIGGGRVGLLTNFTGTMPDLGRSVDALRAAGVPVTALFGPEHGLSGSAQAGGSESESVDERTGLPVFDTYLSTDAELDAMLHDADVDTLVFDMQDIGARFYTYIWTMYDAMRSAARAGLRFVVLDRPNPLGGVWVAGPGVVEPACRSFVGRVDVHQRHGLTAGELARLFACRDLRAEGLELELEVVEMSGWDSHTGARATGQAWVPPSPNIPTLQSAYAFSGMGLIEGTTLSEGRGTTHPFETVGAPFLSARFGEDVREQNLPGLLVRDVWFQPTFHKYVGERCRGVQLHISDFDAYQPVRTAIAVLDAALRDAPDEVHSLPAGARQDPGRSGFALDRLWGSAGLREAMESGQGLGGLACVRSMRTAEVYSGDVLLYER